MPSLSISDFVG
jgi:hypothetical protein